MHIYKSNGLYPCDLNIDLLPQKEMQEYEELCEEFDEKLNSSFGTHVNVLQYVFLATHVLVSN